MRQFVINSTPDTSGLIELTGKDFKYFRQVLRLKPGDMVKVAFKDGITADTTLSKVDDRQKKIILQICSSVNTKTAAPDSSRTDCPRLVLLQFIPKPQKMELIVRQAVESGVSQIIPVIGEYTQKGSEKCLTDKTSDSSAGGHSQRIDRIIKEARQQSGSPVDTSVEKPLNLTQALEYIQTMKEQTVREGKTVLSLALYEKTDGSATMHEAVARCGQKAIGLAVLATGCEGGISPKEIEQLKAAGFIPLHFNINILRCETASLYGMACMQNVLMECEQWQLKE